MPLNQVSTFVRYSDQMVIRSGPRRGPEQLKKQGDLLGVWLDLLNRLDNPARRRATKFRDALRARRDFSSRRSGELVHFRMRELVRTYKP